MATVSSTTTGEVPIGIPDGSEVVVSFKDIMPGVKFVISVPAGSRILSNRLVLRLGATADCFILLTDEEPK